MEPQYHAHTTKAQGASRKRDRKIVRASSLGGLESTHHRDMTGLCYHGRRAVVVTCRRSNQTTLQLGKGGDSCPPPLPMTEELWRVDGFLRGGSTFKGVAPGRARVDGSTLRSVRTAQIRLKGLLEKENRAHKVIGDREVGGDLRELGGGRAI